MIGQTAACPLAFGLVGYCSCCFGAIAAAREPLHANFFGLFSWVSVFML